MHGLSTARVARGMGPDRVLCWSTASASSKALVNVQQSIGRGSAGTEINTIPISAIERTNILRDGAPRSTGGRDRAG